MPPLTLHTAPCIVGRWGTGGDPPWSSEKGGLSPTDTHVHMKLLATHTPGTAVRASPTRRPASHQPHLRRSVPSLTTAFRKPPLATSTCGYGAAWALPKSTWWGRGPSGNCGQPSLPAPRPLSLLRCPGSSGTGPWPSACRGRWCPELRPAPGPVHPHGCHALSSGAPLDMEPLARVFMCQLPAAHESCCP